MDTFAPSNTGMLDLSNIDFNQVAKKLSSQDENIGEAKDRERVQYAILCGSRHQVHRLRVYLCIVPENKELWWVDFEYLIAVINLIGQQMGDLTSLSLWMKTAEITLYY